MGDVCDNCVYQTILWKSIPMQTDMVMSVMTLWCFCLWDSDGDGIGNNADTDDDNDNWSDGLKLPVEPILEIVPANP